MHSHAKSGGSEVGEVGIDPYLGLTTFKRWATMWLRRDERGCGNCKLSKIMQSSLFEDAIMQIPKSIRQPQDAHTRFSTKQLSAVGALAAFQDFSRDQ